MHEFMGQNPWTESSTLKHNRCLRNRKLSNFPSPSVVRRRHGSTGGTELPASGMSESLIWLIENKRDIFPRYGICQIESRTIENCRRHSTYSVLVRWHKYRKRTRWRHRRLCRVGSCLEGCREIITSGLTGTETYWSTPERRAHHRHTRSGPTNLCTCSICLAQCQSYSIELGTWHEHTVGLHFRSRLCYDWIANGRVRVFNAISE